MNLNNIDNAMYYMWKQIPRSLNLIRMDTMHGPEKYIKFSSKQNTHSCP